MFYPAAISRSIRAAKNRAGGVRFYIETLRFSLGAAARQATEWKDCVNRKDGIGGI